MRSRFPPHKAENEAAARFDHVKSCESEDGRAAIEEFWQMAVDSAVEGLMIKVCVFGSYCPSHELIFNYDLPQLLDTGDILEEPNQAKDKPRRKRLPATYEPGETKPYNGGQHCSPTPSHR